jgi:hypothetical protein
MPDRDHPWEVSIGPLRDHCPPEQLGYPQAAVPSKGVGRNGCRSVVVNPFGKRSRGVLDTPNIGQ